MSNIELVRIHTRESNRSGSLPALSDAKRRSDASLGKKAPNEEVDDLEQTPASSVPLLSVRSCPGGHGSFLISAWQWALVFLVPTISISYLAFCYVVHYRVVPAKVSRLATDMSTQLLTSLGSAITTINIIIISLALFPLKSLLFDLKSEEFFRLLATQKGRQGVKLNAINGISSSSYGFIESIIVIVNRRCSIYYVMTFVAAVFVWAVSTLAPAALSIQPILIDGRIMAFAVGAIPPLTLYQPVAGGQTVLPASFSPEPGYSAAVVWAEREISLSYAFSVSNDSQGEYAGLVAPTPLLLNSTTSARWLTDVIGINPYCAWANPANLTATSLNYTLNDTNVPTTAVSVHLEGTNLKVSVPSSYFPGYKSFFVTSINVHDPTVTVVNYTTGSLPTDGSMVMSVIQCASQSTSCTGEAINIVALFLDVTSIPSMGFSFIGADYELSFLVCKPNITIETREVRTQGLMTLEVQPLADGAPPFPRQGNLDWTQTSLLVGYSLSKLTTDSGPSSSAWNGLGSGTQADFMFGSDQMNGIQTGVNFEGTTKVLTALPTDQLAQGYTSMVKASMKPYISGSLGTSYVPGRIASVQQIFVSSMPHVISSTVLIFLLLAMAIVAYFRRGKGDQFNLTNVAAALADSGLPETAKRVKLDVIMTTDGGGRHLGLSPRRWLKDDVGLEVAKQLGDWKVSLQRPIGKADGLETLHISEE